MALSPPVGRLSDVVVGVRMTGSGQERSTRDQISLVLGDTNGATPDDNEVPLQVTGQEHASMGLARRGYPISLAPSLSLDASAVAPRLHERCSRCACRSTRSCGSLRESISTWTDTLVEQY